MTQAWAKRDPKAERRERLKNLRERSRELRSDIQALMDQSAAIPRPTDFDVDGLDRSDPSTPTAIHEAAHAILAEWGGIKVGYATIRSTAEMNSHVKLDDPDFEDPLITEDLHARIRAVLAGPIAQRAHHLGHTSGMGSLETELEAHGGSKDLPIAWSCTELLEEELGRDPNDGERVDAELRRAASQVAQELHRPEVWGSISALARSLTQNRVLTSRDIWAAMKQGGAA